MITYSTPKRGANTKAKLARISPYLREIGPMTHGEIWCPKPYYEQSLNYLADILEEVAAIMHPELFPDHQFKVFEKLPEK